MHDRHGEIQTPLHAAGECVDARIAVSLQADHRQQRVDTLAELGSVHSVNAPEKLQILRCGKLRVKRYFLWRKTDHLANLIWLLRCATTEQDRISARGPSLRREHCNRTGLARSVGAEEAENFPFANLKIQPTDSRGRAVIFA